MVRSASGRPAACCRDPGPCAEGDRGSQDQRAERGQAALRRIAIQSLLGQGSVGMTSSASNEGSPGDM